MSCKNVRMKVSIKIDFDIFFRYIRHLYYANKL